MATRRRRTTRRRTSTTRRTTTRRTTTRRQPRWATALGAAAAMGMIYLYQRMPWYYLVGATGLVVVVAIVWFLWTRRGDIYDEFQDQQAEAATRVAQESQPGDNAREDG